MPRYVYEVILEEGDEEGPVFEVEQSVDEEPLDIHPVTGHKVRRIVQPANIATKHTQVQEKRLNDPDYLKKHGFQRFQKDWSSGKYYETS